MLFAPCAHQLVETWKSCIMLCFKSNSLVLFGYEHNHIVENAYDDVLYGVKVVWYYTMA